MWSIIQSVLAALIGVQKDRKRQQDFASEKPLGFIVAAILVTLIFVLILILVANIAAG
ncbi:DUF2970 domain-containing protein [Vreelandella nigrificans]|uniref:DUF2970 domain-containing protein n=1 Tax=Vreelandella nigrificans TaxID=2042704 RepID=A0A2A4HU14_9GAMM|nr:DUF2970 domain-containing protein [Halomonas nigrificans]PCF97735.1 DUF2970 domain-containing protein [Halomonas nigrificans]